MEYKTEGLFFITSANITTYQNLFLFICNIFSLIFNHLIPSNGSDKPLHLEKKGILHHFSIVVNVMCMHATLPITGLYDFEHGNVCYFNTLCTFIVNPIKNWWLVFVSFFFITVIC